MDTKQDDASLISLKRCQILNKRNASTDKKRTLIITDWDDTLWFTYFLRYEDIDISDIKSRSDYMKLFKLYDNKLAQTIYELKKYGELVVCTNARMSWIDLCLSIVPKTKIALENVAIHSARDEFEHDCDMRMWKTKSFRLIINNALKKGKMYTNIVSLGDADYEHNALINLYNITALKHKYLKSIKFSKTRHIEEFVTQLNGIIKHISVICQKKQHLDMEYDIL
jgi:hypothetical protein